MVTVLQERGWQTFGGWIARSVMAEHIAFDWLSSRKDGSPWPGYWLAVECERSPHLFECADAECEWIRLHPGPMQVKLETLCGLVKLRPDSWFLGSKGTYPAAAAHWRGDRWSMSVVIYEGGHHMLIEAWNGSDWERVELPSPAIEVDLMSRPDTTLEETARVVRAVLAADGRLATERERRHNGVNLKVEPAPSTPRTITYTMPEGVRHPLPAHREHLPPRLTETTRSLVAQRGEMTFEEAYKILGYKPGELAWMSEHYQTAVIKCVTSYTDGGTKHISYQDKERTRAEIEFMA